MADRAITELNAATSMNNADLFVISQGGQAKKVTWETFYTYLAAALDGHGGVNDITYTAPTGTSLVGTMTITLADGTTETFSITNGRGISSIAKTGTSGLTDTYTITYNNGTTSTFTVTNGRSITGITWTESGTSGDGQTHTGTIAYNDGTTSAIVIRDGFKGDTGDAWYVHIKYSHIEPTTDIQMSDVPDDWIGIYSGTSQTAPTSYSSYDWFQYKGQTGATGNSITSVSLVSSLGDVDTYQIDFSDGTSTTFTVTNGSNIDTIAKTGTSGLTDIYTVTLTDGSTSTFTVTNGKGIQSITQTGGSHSAGDSDTYTITFNDGDTFTFQVYNGANGTGTVTSVAGVQAVGNDVPLIQKANGAPTQNTAGQENQLYYDLSSGVLYICLGENGGLYNWAGTGIRIDNALSTTSEFPVQNKVITGKVGTVTLNTTAQNLSGAINEHETDISNIQAQAGSSPLTTTAQTLSGAINELDGEMGNATLTTTAQTVKGAINELKTGQTKDKPLHLTKTLSAGTGSQSFTVSGVTSTMYLINAVFGTPANVGSNITWTTASNSVTFNGTIETGGTTVTFDIIEGRTS